MFYLILKIEERGTTCIQYALHLHISCIGRSSWGRFVIVGSRDIQPLLSTVTGASTTQIDSLKFCNVAGKSNARIAQRDCDTVTTTQARQRT